MKKIIGFFILLMLFVAGCSSAGSSVSDNSPANPVQIGTLPNGSVVYLSNNNLPVSESYPATSTIYLVGGTANTSYSVNFTSSRLQGNHFNFKGQLSQESNGISVTPNTCMIGTLGSGYSNSCKIYISVSDDAYPGTYNIIPTVTSTNESTTVLSPITILVSASVQPSSKAITLFSLNGTTGVISGNNIAVTMPNGTNLSALVATYITTGVSVSIGSVIQANGETANNFTNPVVYTVHAADGSTRDYTVTVTLATSSAKAITAFSLGGTAGIISGTDISVTMPYGTNVTSLIATFTITGQSVTVGSATQTTMITANNFSDPVVYTVHASDGSTQNYTITVTVALNDAKEIIQFSLNGMMGAINQDNRTITVAMPNGTTDVTALTASFIDTGESVTIGGVLQITDTTPNDFSNPVTYAVHAADGTTRNYVVTVTVEPVLVQPTGIVINGNYAFLTSNVSSKITQCVVDESGLFTNCVNVDLGNNLPNGALSISVADNESGTSVATIIGSGATSSDSPVVVSCPVNGDGTLGTPCTAATISPPPGLRTSQSIRLTTNLITATPSSDLITSYSINGMAGVINQTQKSIRVTLPYGVALTNLVANFTTNGAKTTVKVNNITQLSGVTANDFSSGLVYMVTPSGGSTVAYSVSVQNSTFASSALNFPQLTDTIILSVMPWFVTEQPFANPPTAYGYYKLSSPFNMMGLSSIAYTPLGAVAPVLPMYTLTNIEDSLTYTCSMQGLTNIDLANCASTNFVAHPSSAAFVFGGTMASVYYVASYSDNKLVPCAFSGSEVKCGTEFTSLPEISGVGLNYPRGMSFSASKYILSAVNDGDNSYVSCKFSGNPIVATCVKHSF